ncbi:bck1-like resistance to osmotic shock [Tulasnella sp. UAMH 9824]|nr:bck1-like resistance to osmotic shock [Tulasnella sp. UAMH 9824]
MSMEQSPMISIPKKKTEDVDWTGPIRTVIAQSYGESLDNYPSECRPPAVSQAHHPDFYRLRKGVDHIQIASTHSSIAVSPNRSDPEGSRRAFNYFKTAAGMLTYIKDNFLHAPSTDLSQEVIKSLTNIMLAQATEVFLEKLINEKKGSGIVSKVAAQAAYLYTGLTEEVKEFLGRGIFDRNWVNLLQIKAKYFTALSHYHRSIVDTAAGKHSDSLARLNVAEGLAREAHRLGRNFNSDFVSTYSPTLPPDAGISILDLTKSFQALLTEKREKASRDNDLIYNLVVPAEATPPVIDKLSVAQPIPIQEVYGNPDVQRVIGPDIFAKLARGEVKKLEVADREPRSGLETLGWPAGSRQWKRTANAGLEGSEDSRIPPEAQSWATEVRYGGAQPGARRPDPSGRGGQSAPANESPRSWLEG